MRQLYRLCAEMGAARPAVILPARTLKPAHFRDRAGDLLELFCQRQADAIGSFGPEGRDACGPRVSIAATRRVRTRTRGIRQAPITMKTVRTSGNSSGHRHPERDARL